MPRVEPEDLTEASDLEDELITGEAVALALRPAGFALRAAAAAIDAIASWIVFFGLVFAAASTRLFEAVPPQLFAALIITLLVLAWIVGPIIVELTTRGRSLGRLITGSRIVRDDGGAITFRHAFIRALAGFAEFVVLAGGPAALVGFLNRRTKRVGDLLAGTYAQYERVPKELPPLFGVPYELVDWAGTADVARLPAPLARRIRQYLGQAQRMLPQRRDQLARELANETARWVSPVPDAQAESFLAAVVVLRREREAEALRRERDGLARLGPSLTGLPHGFPDRG